MKYTTPGGVEFPDVDLYADALGLSEPAGATLIRSLRDDMLKATGWAQQLLTITDQLTERVELLETANRILAVELNDAEVKLADTVDELTDADAHAATLGADLRATRAQRDDMWTQILELQGTVDRLTLVS